MDKICTSQEQSQKLVELGIDVNTADMHYSTWTILNDGEYILSPNQGQTIEELQKDYGNQVIPAWSLTALFDVLPDELEEGYYLTLFKERKEYCCCYEDNNGDSFKHTFADNPIDACVEMILMLKELKKL